MHRPFGRRLLTGVAAVAAASALATPAYAAGPSVDVALPDVTVAAGGTARVDPILFAAEDTALTRASVTFELSDGLDGVSVAAPDENSTCTSAGAHQLTCEQWGETYVGPDGVIGYFPALVSATAKSLDAKGTLKVTVKADGVTPVSRTVDVTVGEGVDLAAGAPRSLTSKPGAAVNTAFDVQNTTDAVVHGAALLFDTDYAFDPAKHFSNCFYADGYLNACTFDQDLQPGVSYQAVLPYQLRKDTYAPGSEAAVAEWLTEGDWQDVVKFAEQNGYTPGDAGNGGKLVLKELPSVSTLAKQTDTNPDNNWTYVDVTVSGKNGTDLAAIGATVSGAVGDTVKAAVGVRNNGPATLDFSRSGSSPAAVVVTVPAGTSVATAPAGCDKAEGSLRTNADAVQYACFSDLIFPAGTKTTWEFGLKITEVVPNATGAIEVNPACECDVFSKDIKKSNNVAKLVVNPTDTGGEGGGLPVTGPRTALFAGAGVILVAGGAFGLFLARRRKRFEA